MKFQKYNKTIFFVIFLLIFGQINFAQTDTPLTLAQILTGLQSQRSGMSLTQKNSKIIDDIKKRGVSFTLVPQIESSLKEAGANDALIQIIRGKNSKETSNKIKLTSSDFWRQQREKTLNTGVEPVGTEIEEITVPDDLRDGITKQTKKIREMVAAGYKIALDYPDLAKKILDGEIVILPSATETYVIEVGGSVTTDEFTEFTFDKGKKTLAPNSAKVAEIKKVAQMIENFDLKGPTDRRDLKRVFLMTLHPQAKRVLEEIASAYSQKFGRPLRITSLNRSMEYQVDLSRTNANSFLVRSADATPPHASALAFDISYKFMNAEEQQFLMAKLAEMEKAGKVDAMREAGENPAFHVFVFDENKSYSSMSESEKRQFIESKANALLDKFGRTAGDQISAAGLSSIKRFIDGYISKKPGKTDDKTCSFGQNLAAILKRGTEVSPKIQQSFSAKSLAPELGIYIAMIESEFCPCLQSPVGTLGMFQLTRTTAQEKNLNTKTDASPENPDDRCAPDLASEAAASLMEDYISYTKDRISVDYGKNSLGITLAIAAFNSGQGSLRMNVGKVSGKSKVTFWDLMENSEKMSQQFQTENIKYVPKFFAAAIIGENPQMFEISGVQPLTKVK